MKKVLVKQKETNNFWSQCQPKKKYNKKEALTAAKATLRSGRAEQMGVYECDFCKGWHLTHK